MTLRDGLLARPALSVGDPPLAAVGANPGAARLGLGPAQNQSLCEEHMQKEYDDLRQNKSLRSCSISNAEVEQLCICCTTFNVAAHAHLCRLVFGLKLQWD